jgi:hypothetical protein
VCKLIAIFLCSVATAAAGQIGGNHSFDFLQMPAHARLAALGGVNVSLADKDVNFFHNNPALAGDTLNGLASAGYVFYVGDVGNALFTYAHHDREWGQLIAGVQHTRYGTIQGYDESGVETLAYASGETAILVGRAHQIGHMRIGATLKGVFSNIAGYSATALLTDLGAIFQHPDQGFTFGLAFKNLGVVLSNYRENSSERLPFDVQAGVTLKPEHMPVRFSLTGYNLGRSKLLPDVDNASAFQRIVRHVNAGAEILLHKNVNAMLGYNYLLHHTLKSQTADAGAGFSYGFSIFVKPVEFIFSRSAYTVGNAGYSFTLSTNTNQFLKRRKF